MRIRLTSVELLNQLHTRVVSNDMLDCFYDLSGKFKNLMSEHL